MPLKPRKEQFSVKAEENYDLFRDSSPELQNEMVRQSMRGKLSPALDEAVGRYSLRMILEPVDDVSTLNIQE